jgi:alkanesulfonate monooxygenase SsuD/methylene tetrahydromethanopterin reductase-like flavin-dependent oxidoreductase (luciferase family)
MPRIELLTQVFVTKDKAEVERAKEVILKKQRRSVAMLETSGSVVGGRIQGTDIGLSMDDIAHNLIIGNPDEVIEGLTMRKKLGFDGVLMDMSYHLPAHEAVLRSLRAMRDEVLPAVASAA